VIFFKLFTDQTLLNYAHNIIIILMIDTWPEGKYESLILCFDTILFYFITTITNHVLLRNYLNRILNCVEILFFKNTSFAGYTLHT